MYFCSKIAVNSGSVVCLHFSEPRGSLILARRNFQVITPAKMSISTANQWTKSSEEFLIENIRSHRCLWDHRIADYSKKRMKKAAYNAVMSSLRDTFPELHNISAGKFLVLCFTPLLNSSAYRT